MNKSNLTIVVLVSLLIGLGLAYYFYNQTEETSVTISAAPAVPQDQVNKPIVRYPVPETARPQANTPGTADNASTTQLEQSPNSSDAPEASADSSEPITQSRQEKEILQALPTPLPKIQQSDQVLHQFLGKLYPDQALYGLLLQEHFIQKLVTTIDSLTGKDLPRKHFPVAPPEGRFIVSGTEEAPQTSSRNQQRYASYINLLEKVSPRLAVRIYGHFYPLFQTAYEKLGYSSAYFNDRFVYVIEHLLETPNPNDPLLLSQPSVLYQYADPALETLSAGQKLLLRLGHDQRTRVLEMLRAYHQLLVNLPAVL